MNVSFDGILFPASQLLDRTLIARVPVQVYSGSSLGVNPIATVNAGNPIGVIYSYVGGQPGSDLYWMFLRPDGSAYYVRHQSNIFNVSLLQQQGVLSVEQEIEQQQQQQDQFFPGLDLPSFDLGNVAILAGVVLGGLILLNLTKK